MQDSALSTDRRSLRTRVALRDALAAEVAATGDLSRVTVTAVTDRAGVTRRTFYSHYKDIPDLVGKIEEETCDELRVPLAKLADCHLDDLRAALDAGRPAPGAEEILTYFYERGSYLRPLLGESGDPAFAERLKTCAHEAVGKRALDGLDLRALGPLFDYYLTFCISAEVGVLLRWLDGNMAEPVGIMARLMTALMFVRPGDLYDNPINLDLPSFALAAMCARDGATPDEKPEISRSLTLPRNDKESLTLPRNDKESALPRNDKNSAAMRTAGGESNGMAEEASEKPEIPRYARDDSHARNDKKDATTPATKNDAPCAKEDNND